MAGPRNGRDQPVIDGASPEQEEILREILAGLGTTAIERIELGPPPEDEDGAGWGSAPGDVAITVRSPDESLREEWAHWLLAASFDDRSFEAGLPRVVLLRTSRSGMVLHSEPSPPRSRDRTAIEEAIQHAAGLTGALVDRLEILEPYGLAPAVTLAVVEPHAYLRYGWPTFRELSQHFSDERDGSYVEIVDGRTEPAYVTGYARYMGVVRVRDDLACCDPHPPSTLQAPPRPPCPVRERTWGDLMFTTRRHLAETTGRPIAEWLELLAGRRFRDMQDAVTSIAREHDLGLLAASAIADALLNEG